MRARAKRKAKARARTRTLTVTRLAIHRGTETAETEMADLRIAPAVATEMADLRIALAVATVLAAEMVARATAGELSLLHLLRRLLAPAVGEATTHGRDVWPDSTQMAASSTLLRQLVPHRLHRLEEVMVNSLLSRLRQQLSRVLRPIASNRRTLSP